MRTLDTIRAEIDSLDDEISRLIQRRIDLSDEISAAKRESGVRVADPARERAILSRVTAGANPAAESTLRRVFSTLFGVSKARQRTLAGEGGDLLREIDASRAERFPTRSVVACAGIEGSYAQQAACLFFPIPTLLYFNGFEKVFEAVEQGLCPYGVLPVENSAAGSVAAVYDLMHKHRFHIVRALRLKVEHVLLAPKGARLSDIREVLSHPHALAQCRAYLKAHPAMREVPDTNTAVAAKRVAESGRRDLAVIASRSCAELYGLDVIDESIADAAFNFTRFICIAKNMETYPDANKFTVMLSLPHRPGSLNALIARFAAIDVNLTKLESRPLPGQDFEFRFIFDFESRPDNPAVRTLLAELSSDPEIEHFSFLGAYAEK